MNRALRLSLTALLIAGFTTGSVSYSAYGQAQTEPDFTFGPGPGGKQDDEKPPVNQYDPKYRKNLQGTAEDEDGVNLLPNYHYLIALMHPEKSGSKDFTMRVLSPGAITGCLKMTPPKVVIENIAPPHMFLKLEESSIGIDKETKPCKTDNQYAYADLALNGDDLAQKGIKKIVMKSKTVGRFSDIDLDIKDSSITVTATMPDLRRLGLPFSGSTDTFTYWFYPENTVILHTPAVNEDESGVLKEKITRMARAHGLIPMAEALKDFERPRHTLNQFYFIDPTGTLTGTLGPDGEQALIGNIEVPEIFHGPQGPYERPASRAVFARLPGTFD
ncbi:MAG: hypothetical protein KDJ75_09975 [Alphaproteobacteria bacterium]|nr:hypothetical protein [Alphaproteobacteria bacterium]